MPRSSVRNNPLTPERNTLVIYNGHDDAGIDALASSFFGDVVNDPTTVPERRGGRVYACGDLRGRALSKVHVVSDLSLVDNPPPQTVHSGQVPRDVHGVGVLFPRLFDGDDHFCRLQTEHVFQNLTESTKPSHALRRGIYLSQVTREAHQGAEALRFHLMRCSSNLTGPTDNFRSTDREILDTLTNVKGSLFAEDVQLNHVLAQIYDHHRTADNRERKAKIGAHSDKTKDMADHGVMAFCTFYDPGGFAGLVPSETDPFDWVHKNRSGLTTLRFRHKAASDTFFDVPLYPNSVLFIPLSTNREYTHEIRPSSLSIDRCPTRMGYVVRCSAQEALHLNGQTYLCDDGLRPLAPMDVAGARKLRATYRHENCTNDEIAYDDVPFSMNAGDYCKPLL